MKKILALFALVSISIMPVSLYAQQEAIPAGHVHEHSTVAQPESNKDASVAEHSGMDHGKMMAEMKAMDARLDAKIAAMNAAKGDQKIEAMAAVINELVSQRKAMMEKYEAMHQHGMMKHHMMGKEGMMKDHQMMKHSDDTKKDATQNK
jgi:hypothetical protein